MARSESVRVQRWAFQYDKKRKALWGAGEDFIVDGKIVTDFSGCSVEFVEEILQAWRKARFQEVEEEHQRAQKP